MNEKHWTRLRFQREQVSGAVVFFVLPRPFVFLDDIAVVFVEREARGDAGLRDVSHSQPIHVDACRVLDEHRRISFQLLEIRDGFRIHRVAVRIDVAGAVDLGAGHVKEAEGIAVGKRTGFVGVDDIVGNRCDTRSCRGSRTKRAKRRESRHTEF